MGTVEEAEDRKEGEKGPQAAEDPPVVRQLKGLDDQYLELEREYEREARKLLLQYAERQRPLLEERKRVLAETEGSEAPKSGTPALRRFWLEAMQNHPAFEDCIQEWDEAVLEYLADIQKAPLDDADADSKGFKLVFHFVENPYFSNSELTKEYRLALVNPYCGEVEVKEVRASKVEWKAGKDVTVEKVAKKTKGGGAKKAKQRREKEEPRPSFFRDFFRNLTPDMELTEDAREQARSYADEEEEEDDADETLVGYLMEYDHDIATALRDNVVPYAVRWYTGEASPEDDDDDDEEDEEEEEEEEDRLAEEDEDGDSDGEPAPRAKGRAGGGSKSKGGNNKAAEAHNEKECKQQ